MTLRLGELMVRRGLLSERQVEKVLEAQGRTARPFGELAEEMFDLHPSQVEQVWAEQYALNTPRIDPRTERISKDALGLLSRRQAWQFNPLPLRTESGEVCLCTTAENLPRALRFVYRRLEVPAYFVTADADTLAEAIQRHYPMSGGDKPGTGQKGEDGWNSPFVPAA
ncbi:MAG: hypothetical protein ACTS27_07815 [Phycisphaerales bacterium]